LDTLDHYYTLLFFFFQAEDGIRDFHVTGVQTCALPISEIREALVGADEATIERVLSARDLESYRFGYRERVTDVHLPHIRDLPRSEERRVGKECRAGWSAEH